MLKNGLYIGILLWLFSCQSKQIVQNIPIIEAKINPVFPADEIAKQLKTQLNEKSYSSLKYLYNHNNYRPIWENDIVIQQGIEWLLNAKYHGLNPADYNVSTIKETYHKLNTDSSDYIATYAKLDLLLSSSIKNCGQRIRYSELNPKTFHPSWNYPSPTALPNDTMWIKLIYNEKIHQLDHHFEPKHKLYPKLKSELKKIYSSEVSPTTYIKYPEFNLYKGDSNKYVSTVKQKLLGLISHSKESMVFDDNLYQAVKCFQRKHGLNPDGIIGKQTYYFLNWNTDKYISLLKVNMERLRWLPDSILTSGLVVNIPSQHTKLHMNDSCVFSSKVIIGKYKHQTPVFQSDINYLVFNPCWTVPKSIATTTILNGLKRDSSYLQKRKMFICKNGIEINPDSLDFSSYSKAKFPFQVFQHTSPQNALGEVKFMFTNRYNVYMHDTPQQSLFNKDIRAFSHGCIRIQNALGLAKTVLFKLDLQHTPIQKYLSKGYPEKVYLNHTIPINIIYLTCWEEEKSGAIMFCRDIYINDYKLISELKKLD